MPAGGLLLAGWLARVRPWVDGCSICQGLLPALIQLREAAGQLRLYVLVCAHGTCWRKVFRLPCACVGGRACSCACACMCVRVNGMHRGACVSRGSSSKEVYACKLYTELDT